jgi:HlyD family secretion protein
MKKWIYVLLILAVVAGSVYAFLQWRERQQAAAVSSLQTEPAAKGQLTATIGATGQVRSQQTINLNWKTTGTVKDVYVKVGDLVKAGDKLAELEQTSLPQNVILAQAELVSAQKALDDLYTNAENAKIQAMQAVATNTKAVKDAQYQLDNFTPPTNQVRLSTMEAVEQMRKKLDAARAAFEPYKYYPSTDDERERLKEALDQAQADLNAAVKRLEYEYALSIAQANLAKAVKDYEKWKDGPSADDIAAAKSRMAAAEATLKQAWIEAPFDGTVSLASTQVGDQATLNLPAFRLDDLSNLLVDLAVSEVDINQVREGQDVDLTFDAIRGKEYHGVVVEVDRVGSLNQGTVEFVVTVRLDNADEDVRPGMTAAVNIIVNQLDGVLLVPNRAVRFRDGKQVVYLLKNNQQAPVEIELGATSDTVSELILGDIKVGDLIVLNPPQQFEGNGPPPFARQR